MSCACECECVHIPEENKANTISIFLIQTNILQEYVVKFADLMTTVLQWNDLSGMIWGNEWEMSVHVSS